ncbi:hypothetical protein DNTS_015943 [Danionella cerebrum]|uniref:MAD2L1-binding protein n=1 Tax=Danionella cerebrum TaxID=2873325 RepID=A0A553R1T4_9TELE|nr:hypothetical protein DNTS_015943 [Danionella translucida]
MEDSLNRREFDCVKMTVIKFNNSNEISNSDCKNKPLHTNQCVCLDGKISISLEEETEENILCSVDEPHQSSESGVESVCYGDDYREREGNRLCLQYLDISLDQENKDRSTDTSIDTRGDESEEGCQESDALASSSGAPARHVDDEEVYRRAREEGRVNVTFPGWITQDGCCRFVCELLKCILYQRQQMPMTYDQMVFLQKQQHNATQNHRSSKSSQDLDWCRAQRMLQDLDELLAHLEDLFSLSYVPRVLFLLGGSTLLPTEQYEVNMEGVIIGAGEKSLRTSTCLRQLFRILFVADLLSDAKSVRLMTTTVMALAHRNCGVSGFKPKQNFKVPTKPRRQVISIGSDLSHTEEIKKRDLEDYIWYQAPVTVKGFCK